MHDATATCSPSHARDGRSRDPRERARVKRKGMGLAEASRDSEDDVVVFGTDVRILVSAIVVASQSENRLRSHPRLESGFS